MKQYCTFRLEEKLFGLEVSEVQEVIRYQEMTGVPLSEKSINGLINLRGQIVTAIDLRTIFNMPDLGQDAEPMNIVVKDDNSFASLLVDSIGDVIEVNEECYEGVPDTVQGKVRELILGAYKLDSDLLLVLDVVKILKAEEVSAN
jgi:purine-binding chemotaxis protein CheW